MIDFVRRSVALSKPLHTIAEDLMDRCLAPDSDWGGVGCDNMTAMIIAIKDGKTTDEWYEWMKKRVDSGEGYKTPTEMVDPFSQGQGARAPAGQGRGGPPGSLSMALGGARGGEDDEEDGDDEELDLPAIQRALQARMAELARGDHQEGDDEEMETEEATTAAASDSADKAAAAASGADKLPDAPKTSMSPPTTI